MTLITNSPLETSILRVEARKSFALGLWLRDSTERPIDVSDSSLAFTVAKTTRQGQTFLFENKAENTAATLGYIRFNLQASELDLTPGTYQFTITLRSAGYSVVLLKGDLVILQNTDFFSIEQEYVSATPSQTIAVTLQKQHEVRIQSTNFLPPTVLHTPAGGLTGQTLVKMSDTSYDLQWSYLTGGLAAEGIPVDHAPVALGNGSWKWQKLVTLEELESVQSGAEVFTNEAVAEVVTRVISVEEAGLDFQDQLNLLDGDIADLEDDVTTLQTTTTATTNALGTLTTRVDELRDRVDLLARLPVAVNAFGPSTDTITATNWANTSMSPITMTFERAVLLQLECSAWLNMAGGSTGDLRVGIAVTGDADFAPNYPAWGTAMRLASVVYESRSSSKTFSLDAGTYTFRLQAYVGGSGTKQVNYSAMTITPLRWINL